MRSRVSNTALQGQTFSWEDGVAHLLCNDGNSRPFVVTRNKHITPKERLIERLLSVSAARRVSLSHLAGRMCRFLSPLPVQG